METKDVREAVRRRYGAAVKDLKEGGGCCGRAPGATLPEGGGRDPITRDLYAACETTGLPPEALLASFGCGNPTALAQLHPGETVLDLGSGGGIDVLLSARRVGPSGKAYGLDMTPEMLALARENQRKAGVTNAEFLEGHIEDIPLPDASVDVIVSNCVINLSADKDAVLREAFRVLKPGGRFAVSDIVLRRPLPQALQGLVELWTGCVAGALREDEYRAKLAAAGFVDIELVPTREYTRADAEGILCNLPIERTPALEQALSAVDGLVFAAFVRARRPA